jgi:hypothetical protein
MWLHVAAKGFDAVRVPKDETGLIEYTVVYNRTKVVILEGGIE